MASQQQQHQISPHHLPIPAASRVSGGGFCSPTQPPASAAAASSNSQQTTSSASTPATGGGGSFGRLSNLSSLISGVLSSPSAPQDQLDQGGARAGNQKPYGSRDGGRGGSRGGRGSRGRGGGYGRGGYTNTERFNAHGETDGSSRDQQTRVAGGYQGGNRAYGGATQYSRAGDHVPAAPPPPSTGQPPAIMTTPAPQPVPVSQRRSEQSTADSGATPDPPPVRQRSPGLSAAAPQVTLAPSSESGSRFATVLDDAPADEIPMPPPLAGTNTAFPIPPPATPQIGSTTVAPASRLPPVAAATRGSGLISSGSVTGGTASVKSSQSPESPPPSSVSGLPATGPSDGLSGPAAETIPIAKKSWASKAGLKRLIKGNLNKLTCDSFVTITEDIVALEAEVQTMEELQVFVDLIVDTAMLEQEFSEMHCDLLLVLRDRCPDLTVPDAPQNWNPMQACLASKLQTEYESLPMSMSDLPPLKASILEVDEEEAIQRRKRRIVGLFVCTGHLFVRRIVGLKILQQIISQQLMASEDPEEGYVECVCKLLLAVGAYLEEKSPGFIQQIICRLGEIKITGTTRTAFLIDDVLEARGRGWTGRSPGAAPQRSPAAGSAQGSDFLGSRPYMGPRYAEYMRVQMDLYNARIRGLHALKQLGVELACGRLSTTILENLIVGHQVWFPNPLWTRYDYNPEQPPNALARGPAVVADIGGANGPVESNSNGAKIIALPASSAPVDTASNKWPTGENREQFAGGHSSSSSSYSSSSSDDEDEHMSAMLPGQEAEPNLSAESDTGLKEQDPAPLSGRAEVDDMAGHGYFAPNNHPDRQETGGYPGGVPCDWGGTSTQSERPTSPPLIANDFEGYYLMDRVILKRARSEGEQSTSVEKSRASRDCVAADADLQGTCGFWRRIRKDTGFLNCDEKDAFPSSPDSEVVDFGVPVTPGPGSSLSSLLPSADSQRIALRNSPRRPQTPMQRGQLSEISDDEEKNSDSDDRSGEDKSPRPKYIVRVRPPETTLRPALRKAPRSESTSFLHRAYGRSS